MASIHNPGPADRPIETRVAKGKELLRFVDAILRGTEDDRREARDALRSAVDAAAFVDICATVASFNAVVKIADGTGISLEPEKAQRTSALRQELDLDALRKS